MFVVDGIKLVCPICKGELDIVRGNRLFGVLKCRTCNGFYPLGNYFPGIPDLRPRRIRLRLYERVWFRIFGVESEQDYEADIDARMNKLPYYIALLKEEYSTEYSSDVEREFLKEFNGIIGEGRVLSIGCGDDRELRLIGRKGLGIDPFSSNIILSNSLGVKSIASEYA